ncbi:hypothetical protein, partial [Thiolapillus sp.]|uniref:hypothetical protein n=1 Tax=Thiolapillus sp. TaxID=2017437 RepID=UPI003AF70806
HATQRNIPAYPRENAQVSQAAVPAQIIAIDEQLNILADGSQACLRPRDRFWDIPVPKIDSAFDNLLVPQPSWSPSTTQQLRKLVAAPYLAPNDWTPRLDAYFASPLALCARRVSSAASRLLGSTSLRFALHGWQRLCCRRDWILIWPIWTVPVRLPKLRNRFVLLVSILD